MDDWKGKLIAVLVGALIAGATLVIPVMASFPTTEEVSKQVRLESPYVKDQSLILYRLEQIEKKQDEILQRLAPAPE